MKFLLAVTVVLEVDDLSAATAARARILAAAQADSVVVSVSAPQPVASR